MNQTAANAAPWIPAIIGLFGVLIGGMITAAANWTLAVRRERVEAQREEKLRKIELRRVSREIELELADAYAVTKVMIDDKEWLDKNYLPPLSAWKEGQSVIAAHVNDDSWDKISSAIRQVGGIRLEMSYQEFASKLKESDKEGMSKCLAIIKRARGELRSLVSTNHP